MADHRRRCAAARRITTCPPTFAHAWTLSRWSKATPNNLDPWKYIEWFHLPDKTISCLIVYCGKEMPKLYIPSSINICLADWSELINKIGIYISILNLGNLECFSPKKLKKWKYSWFDISLHTKIFPYQNCSDPLWEKLF